MSTRRTETSHDIRGAFDLWPLVEPVGAILQIDLRDDRNLAPKKRMDLRVEEPARAIEPVP